MIPDVVVEARRLYTESETVRGNLVGVQVTAPLVACAELVPGLCDEVERGLEGMRQLLAERDGARAELGRAKGLLERIYDTSSIQSTYPAMWDDICKFGEDAGWFK